MVARTKTENKMEDRVSATGHQSPDTGDRFLSLILLPQKEAMTAMKTFWDSRARQELSERVALLTPEASPLWGQMTARQMLAHVVDALRMAMGDVKAEGKKLPIRFTPLKQLIIYGPPFPKSSPTAPELLTRQADDWDGECTTLRQLMDSFAALPPQNKFPLHPAFGTLSRRAWGVLEYKHLDHHLRQFGV